MGKALGANNKISVIDDSLPILDHDYLHNATWKRCNHLVHSCLLNSFSDLIAQTIAFHENCIDV